MTVKNIDPKNIKIVAFDLDGTLTQHKSPLEPASKQLLDDLSKMLTRSGKSVHSYIGRFLTTSFISLIDIRVFRKCVIQGNLFIDLDIKHKTREGKHQTKIFVELP